jgi:arginine-tRNA-protein transferase
MKIFLSESMVDYGTYTFNYAKYCLKEHPSEIPEIYNKGFLPYSNNVSIDQDVYYLARSLRVDLERFSDTSENRRVLRKIADSAPSFKVIPIDEFDLGSPEFEDYCMEFARARFSGEISLDRLRYILHNKSISHIFQFSLGQEIVGYVIAIVQNGCLHYWFAFFSLDFKELSLGKWMMHAVIRWAADQELDHVYLGTCYGSKSLYKVRDFKGLAYFDGNGWNQDMKMLKAKCKADAEFKGDDFKLDPGVYLARKE